MTTHAFPHARPFNAFDPHVRDTLPPALSANTHYVLVPTGPAVSAEEVESAIEAIEVNVRWGEQTLAITHLDPKKSFWVGEGESLALPEQVFSVSRVPIVDARKHETVVMVPAGARGVVTRGNEARSLGAMLGQNEIPASSKIQGAFEIPLSGDMFVQLEIGASECPIVFEIKTVRAGKTFPLGMASALATGMTGIFALSFFGHAAMISSLAMFMPSLNADDAEAMDRDQLLFMQKMLSAAAEREVDPPKDLLGASDDTGGGSTGAPHKGESGAAGKPTAVATQGRMGFKGTDRQSAVSRKDELELARVFGMAGILAGGSARDPNAPASPWSQETYQGSDEKSAVGQFFGDTINDVAGTGLGLTGSGEGGGGTADVIGLDRVNTVGGGGGGTGKWGIGRGDGDGIGNGHGPGRGGHVAKAPVMRTPTISTNGRLPSEVIQRIVRQNYGRFRLCYENGLKQNPGLNGRVSTKFVIGRDGAVMQSQDAGSDLPDQKVVGCIVRSFQSLSFPQPEGGIATVTYPFVLSPGE